MNRQRTGIADIGHMVEKLQRVDEAAACSAAALELEADETAVAFEVICGPPALLRIIMQARVDDARH